MATKRNYASDTKYESSPEQIAKRSARNKARREYEKIHGNLPSNVDIDHIKPLSKGGNALAMKNLRAVSEKTNTSFARNKDNTLKTQTSKRERTK